MKVLIILCLLPSMVLAQSITGSSKSDIETLVSLSSSSKTQTQTMLMSMGGEFVLHEDMLSIRTEDYTIICDESMDNGSVALLHTSFDYQSKLRIECKRVYKDTRSGIEEDVAWEEYVGTDRIIVLYSDYNRNEYTVLVTKI